MDTAETTIARWEIDRSQTVFFAALVTGIILIAFVLSFLAFFVLQQSTNIVLLVIPIALLLLLLAAVPEFVKSLGSVKENSEVTITNLGIYKKIPTQEQPLFIPWSQMSGYDTAYLSSMTALGKLFPRPIEFFIKSKYSEDNFSVAAVGENADVLRAYFKENNVPFGFAKNS